MSEYRVNSARAVVVAARCTRTRGCFGVRFERGGEGAGWVATWAFAMKERTASREGYDKSEVSGGFTAADGYPGCPHCGAEGMFVCSCGKVGCLRMGSEGARGEAGEVVVCPWCGAKGKLGGAVERLDVSGDR